MSTVLGAQSTLLSRRHLKHLLFDWLDAGSLAERPRYDGLSRSVVEEVLDLAERLAAEKLAPHNRAGDVHEPHMARDEVVVLPEVGAALRAMADAGLIGASLDTDAGGLQLPLVVSTAASAWFHAANSATASYAMLTTAAANLLAAHGTPEQVARWVTPMVEGRFSGTMCLSEPQAGSSLADITTRAEPQEDGTYRVHGTKMWISGGEHQLTENIVHLVIAKVPGGQPGVKGISLFIVPRVLVDEHGQLGERNDVTLAGLNHKMGNRGIVNTVLGFGEGTFRPGGEPGAVGYLVGELHHGLAYMFHMMNEARIGVGVGATALGSTGYLKSLRYARERPQGRGVTDRDPSAPQVPIIEHPDVRRMLLAQKAYVEGAMALVLYCGRLADDSATLADPAARERARLLLEVLTPIAKSWPSQWCLEANSLAIQVHGGYGYSREYDVEQHYRDNRLNAIHEGTHGIQALDLLGRKVAMGGGAGFASLTEAMGETIARARAGGGAPAVLADPLERAVGHLRAVTEQLTRVPDRALALADATVYLEAAGHVVVAWLWLDLLLVTHGEDDEAFLAGKRRAGEYFFRYELPKVAAQLELLATPHRTTLDMQPAWF